MDNREYNSDIYFDKEIEREFIRVKLLLNDNSTPLKMIISTFHQKVLGTKRITEPTDKEKK